MHNGYINIDNENVKITWQLYFSDDIRQQIDPKYCDSYAVRTLTYPINFAQDLVEAVKMD